MKKVFLFLLGFSIAIIPFFANPGYSADTIKIGLASAMSGPVAFGGQTTMKAAQLAIEEINAKGGIRGKKLELVFRDDEHNPTKHVAAVRELVEKEKVVAMIGGTSSPGGLAVAPIVNDEMHVAMVWPHGAATAYIQNQAWKDGKPNYMFRYTMHDDAQAPALVDFATEKLGYKKLAILIENSGWGEGGRVDAVARMTELKLKPLAVEKFNFKDTDLTPQLMRIRNSGAECALFYGQVAEGVQIMRSRARLNYQLPIVSAWGLASASFWDNAGALAEGVYVLVTATPDGEQSPKRHAFFKKYEDKYGKGSMMQHFGGILQSYDIMNLIAIAIEKAGSEDPKKIREALENIPSFEGVLATINRPVWTKDRHDALSKEDFIMCKWTKGKLLPVGK